MIFKKNRYFVPLKAWDRIEVKLDRIVRDYDLDFDDIFIEPQGDGSVLIKLNLAFWSNNFEVLVIINSPEPEVVADENQTLIYLYSKDFDNWKELRWTIFDEIASAIRRNVKQIRKAEQK